MFNFACVYFRRWTSKTFMVARNIPENVGVALLNIFNVHMYNHGNGVVGPNVGTTVLSTAEIVNS